MQRPWHRAFAGAAACVLLAACTPQGAHGPSGSASPKPFGEVGVHGCTPARSLIPGNTTDACGLRVMEAITARLVRADTETGRPVLDLASAIETTDNQLFTIRLAPGRRFHDGTPVRARNFVSAWNWVARGASSMAGARLLDPVEGSSAMRCAGKDCDGRPTELSGLRVVDELTFTLRTTRPVTDVPQRLADPVFAPLPDAFFAEGESKQAYAEKPIGAGPFRFVSSSTTQIVLERFDDYTGPAPSKVKKVVFWLYDDPARGIDAQKAYDDVVADRLDFTAVIPTDMLLDDQWVTDLKDRHTLQDARTPMVLTPVAADRQLAANPTLRRAISRAIDRETISRRIFREMRRPATSWVSPAVPGYPTDGCGELCTYDLAAAKALYAESGGYDGEFQITVNADGGHKEWADSLCNQLTYNLELDCQVQVLPNEKAVLDALESGRLTGLIRQGEGAYAASPDAYLSMYRTGATHNISEHRDKRFDELLDTAGAATDPAEALRLYREAEGRLADAPPSLPLWTSSTAAGWSTRITDVRLTPFGTLDLSEVRVR